MHTPENSHEVPVADAVEQRQEIAAPPSEGVEYGSPPVEADPSDWQQQHQEVAGLDDPDDAPAQDGGYSEGW